MFGLTRKPSKLLAEGHEEATLTRVTTPIGTADLVGKDPATIALSVAVDLVRAMAVETRVR